MTQVNGTLPLDHKGVWHLAFRSFGLVSGLGIRISCFQVETSAPMENLSDLGAGERYNGRSFVLAARFGAVVVNGLIRQEGSTS